LNYIVEMDSLDTIYILSFIKISSGIQRLIEEMQIYRQRGHRLRLLKNVNWKVCGRDRLCGLVVRVTGYRSTGSGSIPGATRFFEK
jgi:hypothetical protein